MNKLSIIVTSYNCNELLERCLKSLEPIANYASIILIDDCSYKRQDKYIPKNMDIYFYRTDKNLGIGAVRNLGIKLCKTNFFTFFDGDDYLEDSMALIEIINNLNESVDIYKISYNWTILKNNNKQTGQSIITDFDQEITNNEYIKKYILNKRHTVTVWNQIYNKDFISKNNIEFEDIRGSEDTIFFFNIHQYNPKIYLLSQPYYHYDKTNLNSLTKTKRSEGDAEIFIQNIKKIYENTNNFYYKIWLFLMLNSFEKAGGGVTKIGYFFKIIFSNIQLHAKLLCTYYLIKKIY